MPELNTNFTPSVMLNIPNALAQNYQLQQQRQAMDTQNALADAVPMLQSDPQNAFATAAAKSPQAALQLLPVIKQMDDEKKAQATERADAIGKLAYTLKTQYPDPAVRKAVALSQASNMAQHGVTPDMLQNFDYSDNSLQMAVNNMQQVKDLIAQSNADRTYQAGRQDHADTLKNEAANRAVTMRGQDLTNARAKESGEFGRGMTGRAYNILAMGLKDPAYRATPEYSTAWQILSNPHVDPNTGTVVVPDLSAFAPPIGAAPGQGAAQGAPGAPGVPPPQRMPTIQSFAPPNPNQAEAASAGYANRLQDASSIIDNNEAALTSLGQKAKAGVPVVGNFLVSPEYQKGDQAERNFINAQLRRESGAAIAESEFENARKQYIPQPGDSKEVLAQKRAARAMAVRNMQLSAGNTLLPPGVIQQSSPPRNAPIVPQQQGFGAPPAPNDPLGIR